MAPIQFIFGYIYSHNTHNLPQNTCVWGNSTFSFSSALILFFPFVRMSTAYNVSSNPPNLQKITLAWIACLCFEIGVCPWPELSSLFQYTSPTPVVSLQLIPRIQYHPGIPVTLLTGSSTILLKASYKDWNERLSDRMNGNSTLANCPASVSLNNW